MAFVAVTKRLLFTLIKQVVISVRVFQRTIFISICLSALLPLYLIYKITGHHYSLIQASKYCIKLSFWMNGIRLKYDKSIVKNIKNEMIWANYFSPFDIAVLFVILPYQSIHFIAKSFFHKNPLKT